MQVGRDGSIQTPAPDVVETLTPEDVEAVLEALRLGLRFDFPEWAERWRLAFAKFERILESQEGEKGRR